MGECVQRVQTPTYNMTKFWGSNIQHDDCSSQYCVLYLKVAKITDLKSSHHTQKKLTHLNMLIINTSYTYIDSSFIL